VSEPANNICSCQDLQQMRGDRTLIQRTNTGQGWLLAGVNNGTATNGAANQPTEFREYTTIRFCPFCGGEILW
jgi:hypothetical protein